MRDEEGQSRRRVGRVFAGFALCITACTHGDHGAAEGVSPDAAPVSARPSTTPPQRLVDSFAAFDGRQRLALCVDQDFTQQIDAAAWPEAHRRLAESRLDAALGDGLTADTLQATCEESFPDRTALATCAGANGTTIAYYSYAMLSADDIEMRDCVKSGGRWVAVARNSIEWHQAKTAYDVEQANEAADRLRRQLGH